MPKFRIFYSYATPGAISDEEIEADDLDQANDIAYDMACERLSSWAEEIEEEE